jgi:purine-cytosine permease-like protein
MFQPNPPTPKALSDDQLNAKIAELQLQPDGLVAAMALIEEQSRLRQEDALELSKWQLESQMQAAVSPAPSEPDLFQDPVSQVVPVEQVSDFVPEPQAPQTTEPEVDIFANLAPVENTEPVASETSAENSAVSAEPVAAPAENIDDIVAALNASYAEVATSPEPTEPSTSSNFERTEEVFPDQAMSQDPDVPEPVEARVLVEEQVTATLTELESESDEELVEVSSTSKAASLSWSWLAVSSTLLTLIFAALLKDSGASVAQAVVLLGGVLLGTSLLAAVGSVAGQRGSSSLLIISRAGFGVWGNAVPAALVLTAKLLWAAALLYFAARVISPLISNQPWFANLASALIVPAEFTSLVSAMIPLLLLAAIISGLGQVVMLRFQQLSTVVSLLGIGAFVFFVASSYSLQDLEMGESLAAATVVDLAMLALAIFGLNVFSVAGDTAAKLPAETPSSKVFFLSFVSTFFLPLVVGMAGVMWLYMAGDTLQSSFVNESLATVAAAAPLWVFVLFTIAIGVSLLHLIAVSLQSISLNRSALIRIPNWVSNLGTAVKVAALVLIPSYFVAASVLQESVIELLLVASVVAAAWAGILISDALVRSRGYHEVSLTREYGFYGKANPANLIGFSLAIALGLGYLDGGPQLTFWAGYLGDLTPEIYSLVGSNIGIAMAFGLAILFPVIFGIPRIRKQEKNLSELDQRRQELKEFLDAVQ